MSAEQKLDRFKQSILNEISRQEEEMHDRMEQEQKSAFEQAENEILAQCYTYIKGETARLQTEAHRSGSERTLEMKKSVLRKRTELCDGLFEELREKLKQFLKSEEYIGYLKKELDEIRKMIPDETNMEIYLSREDAGKLAPENMKVCEKKFPLGGFELIARDEKKFFDARLDSRLTQMRQDFINLFDITV